MKLQSIHYPHISSVPEGIKRPLWSVMIPTYNGAMYLEQTLKSVLAQAPGPEQMQIEVIDDCSTEGDIEEIVNFVGQGRVTFSRNTQNLGLIGNWNACIRHSIGHWIHILHQDDIVLPGFYQSLQKGIDSEPSIGAVFSRHAFIDEDGHWKTLSALESKTAGILMDWLDRIAISQRLQFPSIVVKRSTYERVGGFCAEVHYAADWEMWKRIAAHFPVWYDPQILACYRMHSKSESSKLVCSGSDIADLRKAIELAEVYLPPANARKLSRQAREYYARFALNAVYRMIMVNEFSAATVQIREALACSTSAKVLYDILPLLWIFGKRWLTHKSGI